jgi:hypothetical protein
VCRLSRHKCRRTECFFGKNTARHGAKTDTQFAARGDYGSPPRAGLRVLEVGEALIQSVCNSPQAAVCRMKSGDVGGPWVKVKRLGVSGFLLPTFLCRAPRRKSPWGTKKSRCRPAQGQRQQTKNKPRMPAEAKADHQSTAARKQNLKPAQ